MSAFSLEGPLPPRWNLCDIATGGMAVASVHEAAESILLKPLGTTSDIADAVMFLATDVSSYVTAQTIKFNGGLYFLCARIGHF